MRGEYKVRGGKLVQVELDVIDGRLSSVHLSGDFFVEPDEALDVINGALNGLPAAATTVELAAAISSALPTDARLIGFTPEAVAIAVKRALGGAVSWNDLTFEVLPTLTLAPAMHVALDQVLAARMADGRRGPTMRFWDWDQPLVVIGSFQSYTNEIDAEAAERYGINVVRRITGGGAMFMEPGNCVTYSVIVPATLVEGLSFEASYAFLDEWMIGALAEVGVVASYQPLNDIASEQGKIGGAAQRRFADGGLLHHVTMSYDIDANKMLQVLRIGREKLSDKGTTSAVKRVDPMRSQTGLPREEIITRFTAYFQQRYRCIETPYRDDELAEAEELVRTKFASPEWTHRVP
ncbi:MAG: lipoate--protein ligase family protein [Propionibacteriaceae bacterium]|jgi:lipoate-protein ligase A|nr:lipoate--protein ligase family protein [Propionibacteriaceae bacterium]